jgi:signal transduction histidine kinase
MRLSGDRRVRRLAGVIVLAALYRGTAEIGYSLQFAGPVAAIVWLPVGLGVAFLYIAGLRYWPGILISDLLANDYDALPLGAALGQTAGNLLEVVTIAVLLRALVPNGDPLANLGDLGRMFLAIVAGTTVSATIGPLSLWLGGVIELTAIPRVWRTWWLGDASGALVVLPLAVAWARPPRREWWRRRGAEAALTLAVLVGISELALHAGAPDAYPYLLFPPLIWAALRLGRHGATLGIAVAAGFAVWETTRQVGPFAYESVTQSVLATQLFIAVAAATTLCLTVVTAERKRAVERLAESRMRIVEAGDNERRRIEHNLHDGAQQRLTALVVQLGLFADRARTHPDPSAADLFDEAAHEIVLAIDELRELAQGIHPSVLRDLGLARAVQSVALRSRIPLRRVEMPDARFDPLAEAAAYYVVAEALTNVVKYGQASAAEVSVATDNGTVTVTVSDDGVGGADPAHGSGLRGLADRVEALEGRLVVTSPRGRGTTVRAEIPIESPAA